MKKEIKIAIGTGLVLLAAAAASKVKNAINKITFRITGFAILGLTAGGLRVRFRSEFVNDTGQSFTVTDLLSKLFYKEGTEYKEFARASNIPTISFPHGKPVTIDSVFIIDFTQLPYLFKSDVFRIGSYYTVLGFEQNDNFDMKVTDLKKETATLIKSSSFVPSFIKNLIAGKGLSGYRAPFIPNVQDLAPNQYQVV